MADRMWEHVHYGVCGGQGECSGLVLPFSLWDRGLNSIIKLVPDVPFLIPSKHFTVPILLDVVAQSLTPALGGRGRQLSV